MGAVAERSSTIEQPKAFLVESNQAQWPSTHAQVTIAPGRMRMLPPTHAKSWEYAMARLTEKLFMYRGLDEDWDGYGGQPATYGSFSNAMEFVQKLTKRFELPASMLAGDGEISLFWKRNGSYLEISFPGDNSYHFIYKDSNEVFASPDLSFDTYQLDSQFIGYLARI
ncbi:hypothetical protein F3I62_03605 [Pseudomonas sp. R-28-1W-6]|uniref:hypothetical protein n=1 Tax=Pseudomonas sp. R-28-1W-6 TaxID=2650101 RepID=UPI0013660BB2|nr:hypothetical protein [Pseudomonas sp. R-28-1W-6]MWV11174.1 hypothetical protein [Pseudomonas sp. R-28-1W-6]